MKIREVPFGVLIWSETDADYDKLLKIIQKLPGLDNLSVLLRTKLYLAVEGGGAKIDVTNRGTNFELGYSYGGLYIELSSDKVFVCATTEAYKQYFLTVDEKTTANLDIVPKIHSPNARYNISENDARYKVL